MENNSNKCYRCRAFSRYYVKSVTKFNMTKHGLCCELGKTVSGGDGCEKFVLRRRSKTLSQPIKFCLNSLLTEISQLRAIIEEESGETD